METLTVTESRFLLVGHPGSLADAGVGISENTVIEYMVDQWGGGVPKVAIPQVPVRLEMLREGKISQACLTDAMAWSLLSSGFPILKDQADGGETPAVLTFSKDVLADTASKKGFIEDWNQAVGKINADPEGHRSLLEQYARIPGDESNPYPIPLYDEVKLPSEGQINRVIEWYETKFEVTLNIDYKDVVISIE